MKIRMSANKKPKSQNTFWKMKKDSESNTGEIVLYGEIASQSWYEDDVTPKKFDDELKALGNITELNVRINSPGGDLFAGQTIYSILKRLSIPVNVYIDGLAASAASVIAMAGGRVIMPKNSMLMIHNPWTYAVGDSEKLRKQADTLDEIRESVLVAYQDKSGLTREEIITIMKAETWLTAEESVKNGFADEIENTEVSMSIDTENIIFNGISIPAIEIYKNKVDRKGGQKPHKERESFMELSILCKALGLDYQMLKGKGLTDDQIKAVCETAISNKGDQLEPKENTEPPKLEVNEAFNHQNRAVEIVNMCSKLEIEQSVMMEYLKSDMSIEDINKQVLNKMMDSKKPLPASAGHVEIIAAEEDKIKNVISDALLLRGGLKLKNPAEGVNDFRNMSLQNIAIDCLSRNGINNAHRMSKDQLFKMAMSPDSQFSSIVSTAANKSVSNAYELSNPTFKIWTSVGQASDFKAAPHFQFSQAGSLTLISGNNGEIPFSELSDQYVNKQVLTYAQGFGLTRQAMINDDVSAVTRIPMIYTAGAIADLNRFVYALLAANGNMSYDSTALFHANHGNLAGTGAAISSTTIAAGRAAIRIQKDLAGNKTLNIVPVYMIVPAALEQKANMYCLSASDPDVTSIGAVNVNKGAITPVVDAVLDEYSAKAWYFAGDQNLCDTVEVTYLNGNQSPILEFQSSWDRPGIEFRLLFDAGITVLDHRALYKNAGPA